MVNKVDMREDKYKRLAGTKVLALVSKDNSLRLFQLIRELFVH